jgi:hypothetical protein
VLQYHARHLALVDPKDINGTRSRQPSQPHSEPAFLNPALPGFLLRRDYGHIRGSVDEGNDPLAIIMTLRERVSSVSLSIVNSENAPYTVTVVADTAHSLVETDPYLARGDFDEAGDSVFPDHTTVAANGLVPCGRCSGLTQFLLMVHAVLGQWEKEWMQALRAMTNLDGSGRSQVSMFSLPLSTHDIEPP